MNIVGAGAAGLSLALMVPGSRVLEKEQIAGGLCRSTTIDGFTFDTGPHILGGIPDAVRWVVESTGIEFVEGRTRNVGFVGGKYVAHPFQDPDVGQRYMAKMWKMDPAMLAPSGLGAQQGRKPGGVSSFLYPRSGGYQSITDSWAGQLGDRVTYGVGCEPGVDEVWTGPVEGGRYNTLVTVTAGFEGTAPDLTAIYLPEDWTPFHRLSFPSAFAPGNAPRRCFSVQGEIALGGYLMHPGAFGSAFLGTIDALGIRYERSVFLHTDLIENAYPVPVANPPRTPNGHGRTGSLRYLNVDGVVAQSMERASVPVG